MLALVLALSLLLPTAGESAIKGSFTVWGMSAAFGPPTPLNSYDTSGVVLKSFTGAEPGGYCLAPTPVPGCNGRGVAVVHKQLWVSVVDSAFAGTGVIKQVDTTTGAVVATIPDPCGSSGTGAMDDFRDDLLIACYNGFGSANNLVFLIDASGAVLGSCGLGPGQGNDTIAVRDGGRFLTDNGETPLDGVLTEYDVPSTVGTDPCTPTGTTYPVPAITGISFVHGSPRLLGSHVLFIQDFGGPPYSAFEGEFLTGALIEDIAVSN